MISDLEKMEAGGQTDLLGQKEPLVCISLWQPWAQWVILGWKPIETRLHPRFEKLVGKRIGIHAALTWDKNGLKAARPYLTAEQIEQTYEMLGKGPHDGGKVLGTVFVRDHRIVEPGDAAAALIECYTIRYGLFLRDPIRFASPIQAVGRQGVFKVNLAA